MVFNPLGILLTEWRPPPPGRPPVNLITFGVVGGSAGCARGGRQTLHDPFQPRPGPAGAVTPAPPAGPAAALLGGPAGATANLRGPLPAGGGQGVGTTRARPPPPGTRLRPVPASAPDERGRSERACQVAAHAARGPPPPPHSSDLPT